MTLRKGIPETLHGYRRAAVKLETLLSWTFKMPTLPGVEGGSLAEVMRFQGPPVAGEWVIS